MQINIGDTVKIINNGEVYSSYEDKFKELGFKNKKFNPSFENGTICKVFNITTHGYNSSVIMLAVRDEFERECLIGSTGVTLLDDNIYLHLV